MGEYESTYHKHLRTSLLSLPPSLSTSTPLKPEGAISFNREDTPPWSMQNSNRHFLPPSLPLFLPPSFPTSMPLNPKALSPSIAKTQRSGPWTAAAAMA